MKLVIILIICYFAVCVNSNQYVVGEIDEHSMTQLINNIKHDIKYDVTTIHLIIKSLGGIIDDGVRLINLMNSLQFQNVKFYCFVDEYAASTAFYIFQYCSKRYISTNAILLQHHISFTTDDDNITYPIKQIFTCDIDDNCTIKFSIDMSIDEAINDYIVDGIKKELMMNQYVANKINMSIGTMYDILDKGDWITKHDDILKYKLTDFVYDLDG